MTSKNRIATETVFKVVALRDLHKACHDGSFTGSVDDMRDGFIHLSAGHQLEGTLAKHFAGHDDLVLIAFHARDLGPRLRWEASRSGDLFPHLYGPLPATAALWARPLAIRDDGIAVLPEELAAC
jgi:uncharacterized protein (DUF952 family)